MPGFVVYYLNNASVEEEDELLEEVEEVRPLEKCHDCPNFHFYSHHQFQTNIGQRSDPDPGLDFDDLALDQLVSFRYFHQILKLKTN